MKETVADPVRLTENCGAIALGHDLDASDAKLMTTLGHALKNQGECYGRQTIYEGNRFQLTH